MSNKKPYNPDRGCFADPVIWTGSTYLSLTRPAPEEIDIRDIAHNLSYIPRFNGATFSPYSVLEHTLWCYDYAAFLGYNDKILFQILMHDATEAYLGDMPRPIKLLVPDFAKLEERVWVAICDKWDIDYDLYDETKQVDEAALAREKHELISEKAGEWPRMVNVPDFPLSRWDNEMDANSEFLWIFSSFQK